MPHIHAANHHFRSHARNNNYNSNNNNHPIYSLLNALTSSTTTTSTTTTFSPLAPDEESYDDDIDDAQKGMYDYSQGSSPFMFIGSPSTNRPVFMNNNMPIKHNPMMSMAVLMLIVVASLSLVVGAIYLLIYFKSIKPMSARSRSYVDQGGKTDDDGGRSKSAHPFFRRK